MAGGQTVGGKRVRAEFNVTPLSDHLSTSEPTFQTEVETPAAPQLKPIVVAVKFISLRRLPAREGRAGQGHDWHGLVWSGQATVN